MMDTMKAKAADLDQLVKSQPRNSQSKPPEVTVPQLRQVPYKDPRDPEYERIRLNKVGGVENRETEAAIKMKHTTIHTMA
jgi:hypothetical protein